MARLKGTVVRPPLDWYAEHAQSAQQWFTGSVPSYWAFTLRNNSTGGSKLWVYDAQSASGPNFGTGTGNPSGNSAATAGWTGGNNGVISTPALISETNTGTFGTTITGNAPAGLVAGNLLIAIIFAGAGPASNVQPPDVTWIRLGGSDVVSGSTTIAAFGHVITANEPATYAFTITGAATGLGQHLAQFSGLENPGFLDTSLDNKSGPSVTTIVAPGIITTGTSDMIFCVWASGDHGQTISGPASGFTMFAQRQTQGLKWIDGFMVSVAPGAAGPFNGSQTIPEPFNALTIGLKASNVALAPGQTLSSPILTAAPLEPGLLTLQFGTTPLGLTGNIFWLPPANDFKWDRDAPIAVVNSGLNFNLAGITPEQAAWASMSWVTIK